MTRILLGESDSSTRELLSIALKHAGLDVVSATSGLKLLEVARRFRPHLVLANVKLLGLGGCEVCRVVRADQLLKGTKVVLFGSLDEDDVQWRNAGADLFLQQPIDVRHIAAVLTSLLGVKTPVIELPAVG